MQQHDVKALHDMVREGNLEGLKKAIADGASIESEHPYSPGYTLLRRAVVKEMWDIAEYLLEQGADIHGLDNNKKTVFHEVLSKVSDDDEKPFTLLKILIEKGANIHDLDANDWRPVQFAAMIGHLELVDLLLDHGADINAVSSYGETILNTTAKLCKNPEFMLRHLILKGADTSQRDQEGRNIFDTLSMLGKEDLLPCIEAAIREKQDIADKKITDIAHKALNAPASGIKTRKLKPRHP